MTRVFQPVAPGVRLGFSHTRPAFVVDDLSELHGPTTGVVTLPLHIDWTPSSTYDLSDPGRVRAMYAVVLREAGSEAEVAEWLDRDLLIEHWARIGLPRFVRAAWEHAHPTLQRGNER